MDFGIFQMDTIIDRIDVKRNQFLVLTQFGEHTLHHLFPTIDHGLLPQLKDLVLETCQEFGTELREYPWYKLIQGHYQQLARTEPRSLEERGRKTFL
jgi:fatty acid desaturase